MDKRLTIVFYLLVGCGGADTATLSGTVTHFFGDNVASIEQVEIAGVRISDNDLTRFQDGTFNFRIENVPRETQVLRAIGGSTAVSTYSQVVDVSSMTEVNFGFLNSGERNTVVTQANVQNLDIDESLGVLMVEVAGEDARTFALRSVTDGSGLPGYVLSVGDSLAELSFPTDNSTQVDANNRRVFFGDLQPGNYILLLCGAACFDGQGNAIPDSVFDISVPNVTEPLVIAMGLQ